VPSSAISTTIPYPLGLTDPWKGPQAQGARYALWKNPDDLTECQTAKLAWDRQDRPRLHRAYLLKEGLRQVFSVKGEEGKQALDRWISWAALPHPGVCGAGRPLALSGHRPSLPDRTRHPRISQ